MGLLRREQTLKIAFRWIIRIVLGIFLIFTAACAVLYVRNPDTAWILAGLILEPLISNTKPPAIAEGVLTAADWGHWDDTNRKLNAVIEQNFPIGTSEAALRAKLLEQGFKPPPPPPADCWPHDKPAPIGRVIRPCPTFDLSKMLEYKWSSFPCGKTITVRWTTDHTNELTRVTGGYYVGCL
jgi:hypothetical protein